MPQKKIVKDLPAHLYSDAKGDILPLESFPLRVIVCFADLVDCFEMTTEWIRTISLPELERGGWGLGRFAWQLNNVEPLGQPILTRDYQGLWNYSDAGFRNR